MTAAGSSSGGGAEDDDAATTMPLLPCSEAPTSSLSSDTVKKNRIPTSNTGWSKGGGEGGRTVVVFGEDATTSHGGATLVDINDRRSGSH